MRQRGHILKQHGFSLVETMVASGVLTVGLLGMASVFAKGIQRVGNSPTDLIATQKAAEAIESVYTARDSHIHTWADIRNIKGASGTDGGIFLDGPQQLRDQGPDGLSNTADDGAIQQIVTPGPDGLMNTADDEVQVLSNYTREVEIRDINPSLRQIRVVVRYNYGSEVREFILETYISNYA